jgi:hypothetical protein
MGRDISSNKVSTDKTFTRNSHVDYNEKENERERSDDFFNVYRIKSIILLVFVIILYVIFFSILNSESLNTPDTKPWILIIEVFLWVVLIVILVMNVRYFNDKDFDFNNTFKHLFDDDKKPELEVHVKKEMEVKPRICKDDEGEVFHVGRNDYTYETAREVCDSYGSRLASYDEVEKAYMNGANWCSYGWSDGQMALFPIQKAVFNELKQVPGRQHDCGRPGVNGGYIKNKDIKFGVNCYGKKPYATDKDVEYFKKHQYLPVTRDEIQKEKDKKVGKLLVSPFNKEKWSDSL